ncbi:MAG TPA: NAD(P)/FAD-dependent oxidoreductase, partial [Planctomycetota bacterium]|nr:NAD(P)/FAD-dependent oxidoreductase [Planctomycetota bacterium]
LANFEASPQFRLVDGYGALVERMRRALDRNVRVVENAVVDEIRWKPGEAEVRCGGGGKVRGAWRASAVVVTLPVGVLQRRPGERGAVRFSPPPCDHLEAAERLVDGPIVKVAVAFREPLWERPDVQAAAGAGADLADAVFLHDRGAPFPTWWTLRPLRAPMLVGWAGGPRTEGLVGRDSAEIADAAIRSLASLFGLTAARVRDAIVGVRACDWTSDPYARGAYSYVSVGALKARAALARPLAETLFFAGEATDDAGQAGTVAGALASGRRAAEEVRAASAGRGAGGDAARRRPSSSTSVEREAAAR